MRSTSEIQWEFGGPLTSASPGLAWTVLLAVLALGLYLAYANYFKRSGTIPKHRRRILFLLRAFFLCGVVLCLANPTRIERHLLDAPAPQPLAVLIDRSASMTLPDNRGQTRLESASRQWEKIRNHAQEHFQEIEYASFAREMKSAGSWEAAVSADLPDAETMLFESLSTLLEKAPLGGYGGILTVTDGVDTSQESVSPLLGQLLASRTPLYFLPGTNRLRPRALLQIREVDLPQEVVRQSEFNYHAVIEIFAETDREMKISIKKDDGPPFTETVKVKAGNTLFPWSHKLASAEPGDVQIEFTVEDGERSKTALHQVRVLETLDSNILYYQGALDWGFHFMNRVMSREPGFKITALFNPRSGATIRSGTDKDDTTGLPDRARGLTKFQTVILANVFISQLSALQQQALSDYVRDGGGLLVILPNTEAAIDFAGSPLEAMLPVVFENESSLSRREAAEADLLSKVGQSQAIQQRGPLPMNAAALDVLKPFKIPENSPLSALLETPGANASQRIVPKFVDYAKVQSAKPGAEILAEHPTERNPATGQPRILLATQAFGKGKVSVLTTDSLWRWHLSIPSGSKEASTFWQQLLLWLGQSASQEKLRFVERTTETPSGAISTLTLSGSEETPVVTATGPEGKVAAVKIESGETPMEWSVQWKPDVEGVWRLQAEAGVQRTADRFFLSTDASAFSKDDSHLPPAMDTMRELAAATGGTLIQGAAPASWSAGTGMVEPQMVSERRELLWNQWWLLLTIFGAYAVELILRRRWQLV